MLKLMKYNIPIVILRYWKMILKIKFNKTKIKLTFILKNPEYTLQKILLSNTYQTQIFIIPKLN